ncbi:MAG: S8 family peptidase [candidate division WOR-3 bacterium]
MLVCLSLFILLESVAIDRPALLPVGETELGLVRRLVDAHSSGLDKPELMARDLCFGPDAGTPSLETGVSDSHQDLVPGQLVVAFAPEQRQTVLQVVEQLGGRIVKESQTGGDFMVVAFPQTQDIGALQNSAPDLKCIPEATVCMKDAQAVCPLSGSVTSAISRLCCTPGVRYAEPVVRMKACYQPDDPHYLRHQWGHWVMYSDLAWDLSLGSSSVRVAVVDQGADYRHPDLSSSFEPTLKGYDFVDQDDDPLPVSTNEYHGTHVAGIIAAGLGNGQGVAGWARVTLYSCRVLNDSGSGTNVDVADGIRWAADHGCRIANLSLGGTTGSATLRDAVTYAHDKGVLVIGAAGNDGNGTLYYPGAYDHALAVAALDSIGVRASYSNWGPELDLIAPGTGIMSTYPGSSYQFISGTSMATPEVSGAAALLFSYRPDLSPDAARAILKASAIDMGDKGWDKYYGYGLVNAYRALQLAVLYDEAGSRKANPVSCSALRASPSDLRIRVYDATGRLAAPLVQCQSSGLTPGIYFTISPDRAQTRRIVAR